MLTTKEIKRRIKAIRNIQQITKAMKLIAATKLQRAQQRMLQHRVYRETVVQIASECALRAEAPHPFLEEPKATSKLFVLFTAERGLCGAFNSNLIKYTQSRMNSGSFLLAVGRKGFLYFKEKGYNIKEFFQLKEEKVHEQTREVAECIKEIFLKERMSSYMIYNKFESVFRQRVVQEPLLPVPPAARRKYVTDHIYEPSVEVMDRFLHHYLYVQLLHAAFESFVSEHAARMIAMDAATSNAAQMIEELTLEFNKARQAAITKEITEITATKEAMVSGG